MEKILEDIYRETYRNKVGRIEWKKISEVKI
jgi:hypothetical protein